MNIMTQGNVCLYIFFHSFISRQIKSILVLFQGRFSGILISVTRWIELIYTEYLQMKLPDSRVNMQD